MAPKFGFKITADDDTTKGTKSAEKNMEKLGTAGKKAAKVLTGAFAAFSLAKLGSELNKMTKLFGEQEKAELRLIAAARNNPYLNGDSVKALEEYASGLQKISVFGDEAIIQQQAFLGTLQMSEDQINGVLDAAVNLASTGIVSLEGAVRNISKTYAGMTGELGELLPQLRELTTEELKAGAAVELISEQYAGLAEAAASGITGFREQIGNMLGDLQETIGGALAPVFKTLLSRSKETIQKLIDWFTEHANQITNFFINLPEIVGLSFGLVKDIMARAFSVDGMANTWSALMTFITNQTETLSTHLLGVIGALADVVWIPLKVGFEGIIWDIKTAWNKLGDNLFGVEGAWSILLEGFIDTIRAIGDAFTNIGIQAAAWAKHPLSGARRDEYIAAREAERDAARDPSGLFGSGGAVDLYTFGEGQDPAGRPSLDPKAMAQLFADAMGKLAPFAADTWEDIKTLGSDIGAGFEDLTSGFSGDLEAILNRELEDSIKSPVLSLVDSLEDQPAKIADAINGRGSGSARGLSLDMGNMNTTAGSQQGQAIAGLLDSLGAMAGGFMDAAMSIGAVVAIMDPMKIVIDSFVQTIAGPITKALAPLIGIFVTLGQLLGNILVPIINLLAPVIEGLAEIFVWLYNKVFLPIGKILIGIFTVVYDVVAGIANVILTILNGVLGLVNKIPGIDIPLLGLLSMASPKDTASSLQEISLDSVVAGGTDYAGGDMVAGSGASITGGHDVTINFQINTDVLVGDRRELAEWVAEEIQNSMELGTVAS